MLRINRLRRRWTRLSILGSVILMSTTSAAIFAQKRSDPTVAGSAASRRERILARESDLANRELNFRLLRDQAKAGKPTAQNLKLARTQIFDDFERIQIISREMRSNTAVSLSPNYKLISGKAKELHTRAKRLKTNLAVPDLEQSDVVVTQALATNDDQMRAFVNTLNQLVKDFVTNPVFQNPKVTEVRQFMMLRQNLLAIIEISHSIKRSAEKLKR
jgi:hypothetical protein